jgi:hypothetical protein
MSAAADQRGLGSHVHCGIERMLAALATSRLRQIIRTGDDIDRQLVRVEASRSSRTTAILVALHSTTEVVAHSFRRRLENEETPPYP